MRTTIKQTLFAPALLLLAAVLGMAGCTNDDFGRQPEGSILLEVGDVTVAGMKTNTRVATIENAAGYTGIRKSTFINGDELILTLSNDGNATNSTVTATLTDGAWVLSEKVYIIPGTTTIEAAYTATEQIAGIKPDVLKAATYTLTGQKVVFDMKHANAMIDITTPKDVTIENITLSVYNGTTNETLTTTPEEEADGTIRYRTIALPGTVQSITAVIAGQSYVALLTPSLIVETNKKHPVTLTFEENKLTAAVGTAALNWGMGDTTSVVPVGYTYIIDSPEALAQFATEYSSEAGPDVFALQTADIDMSKLKPAATAGINPMTGGPYTYTITADNWKSIGGINNGFQGTYNGNGYTISNLQSTDGYGLFLTVTNATLTGIHLRGANVQGVKATGCLARVVQTSTINLCSATGTLHCTSNSYSAYIGGLIGDIHLSTITRCSADVDITADASGLGNSAMGGLIGLCRGGIVAGCMATGNVTNNSSGTGNRTGGLIGYFVHGGISGRIIGCLATGSVTKASGTAYALLADSETGSVGVFSCFATGSGYDFSQMSGGVTYSDCAYTGTQTKAIAGITGDVSVDNIYATITAGNTSVADIKTLHWSKVDGYTLDEVTRTWDATEVWKDNGTAAPTLDMTYEGTDVPLYNGAVPNLLAIPGQTAYYVAPVNAQKADGAETMPWDEAMAANACPDGWHIPTKDDFMAMTGLPADDKDYDTNYAAIKAAFPDGVYWSSTVYESIDLIAWSLNVHDNSKSRICSSIKASSYRVRCVRKK